MQLIETRSSSQDFTWIDITAPSAEDLAEVGKRYSLSNHNLQDCLEPDHLPKFEEDDEYNFIILRKVVPQQSKTDSINALTTKIAIFYNEKTLVTIHRLPQPDVFAACERSVHNGKPVQVYKLLLRIIARVHASYADYSATLNEEIEEYENRLLIRKTSVESIENLYILKRRAGRCRRLLLLTGEVVSAVQNRQKRSNELQDVTDSQAKLQLFFDQLNEEAHSLIDTYLSYSSHKTNEVMKVLTLFSAYFLPLTFIVGIYGMNFEFMPELKWTYGYPAIMLVMLVIFITIFLWFKRKNWH